MLRTSPVAARDLVATRNARCEAGPGLGTTVSPTDPWPSAALLADVTAA